MARVAFILADDFEDSEFRVPYDRVKSAGHEVAVVGISRDKELHGKKGKETIKPDLVIDEVTPEQFDAVVIPGGYSPDKLRTSQQMVGLVRQVFAANKPVAAICHAGSMLIEAELVDGRTVTSWPSIQTDLVNAGARWVNRPLVEDGNLITSRKPDDLPQFTDAILRQLEGRVPDRVAPPQGTSSPSGTTRYA